MNNLKQKIIALKKGEILQRVVIRLIREHDNNITSRTSKNLLCEFQYGIIQIFLNSIQGLKVLIQPENRITGKLFFPCKLCG